MSTPTPASPTTFDWLSDGTGPLSSLRSVLRSDNKASLLEILTRDPRTVSSPPSVPNPKKANPGLSPLTWKQRLVFGDESLKELISRNVLGDTGVWNNSSAIATAKKLKSEMQKRHSILGIVDSLVLSDLESSGVTDILDISSVDVMIYILRPSPEDALTVSRAILNLQDRSPHHTGHRIVFLPYPSAMCSRILTDSGVLSSESVSVEHVRLDLVPLEKDVLSMELPYVTRECDVEGCPSACVTAVATAIRKMERVCGTIPRVQGLGPLAEDVISKCMSLRLEEHHCGEDDGDGDGDDAAGGNGDTMSKQIHAMIVIDRKIDLVTPLLTPLTYEGLIDEILGIEGGFVEVEDSVVEPRKEEEGEDKPAEMVALALNGSDTLYDEVRNQNVEKFGSFLQNQAIALKESHSNFTSKDKDLTQIHQFVKQIPIFTQNLRSLTQHIHLAEAVKKITDGMPFRQKWQTERAMLEGESCYDVLEEKIACMDEVLEVLRLICLQSVTGGGLKGAKFDSLRREVVHTYGYQLIFALQNLEKIGLLAKREMSWVDSGSPFSTLRKMLVLINADVSSVEPNDIAYVSSGYAPLTVRLVQAATQGWAGKDEALRLLPGRLVDIKQRDPPEDAAQAKKRGPGTRMLGGNANATTVADVVEKKPVLIVFYVGGVGFMEIAALRFLSKRGAFPYDIVCCTTSIINGNTFLKSLF